MTYPQPDRELHAAAALPLPYEAAPTVTPTVPDGFRTYYDDRGRPMVLPINLLAPQLHGEGDAAQVDDVDAGHRRPLPQPQPRSLHAAAALELPREEDSPVARPTVPAGHRTFYDGMGRPMVMPADPITGQPLLRTPPMPNGSNDTAK